MKLRRALLYIPRKPSEDALAVIRLIKAALVTEYQVRVQIEDENDDDLTPVDRQSHEALLVLQLIEVEPYTTH
jgi:hypothetical protein